MEKELGSARGGVDAPFKVAAMGGAGAFAGAYWLVDFLEGWAASRVIESDADFPEVALLTRPSLGVGLDGRPSSEFQSGARAAASAAAALGAHAFPLCHSLCMAMDALPSEDRCGWIDSAGAALDHFQSQGHGSILVIGSPFTARHPGMSARFEARGMSPFWCDPELAGLSAEVIESFAASGTAGPSYPRWHRLCMQALNRGDCPWLACTELSAAMMSKGDLKPWRRAGGLDSFHAWGLWFEKVWSGRIGVDGVGAK